ncbi:hypothetical protein [Propionivibrio sp.]|uniref:hypothetical protein n=1 Tax=Propionivibrio sp. TaxID=2212460 RepID=UPI0039E56B8E
MSKKKLKKMLRKAIKNGYGQNGAAGYENYGAGGEDGYGYGFPGAYGGKDAAQQQGLGLLRGLGLPRGLGAGTTEQFVIGALLGAAAAYVLADEELRGKIMKSAMKLYTGLAGGVEEFKEQMADLKAEIEAEHGA